MVGSIHAEENNSETNEQDRYQTSLDAMDINETTEFTDPLWDTAHFLLRVTQEQGLTYDGIENFCISMKDYKEILSDKISHQIEQKLKCHQGCFLDDGISKDILSAIETEDDFSSLKSRYIREKYYEQHFNYKVFYT